MKGQTITIIRTGTLHASLSAQKHAAHQLPRIVVARGPPRPISASDL